MNKFVLFLLTTLLAWWIKPVHSQSIAPPYHRWYVGMQLASHYYAVVYPNGSPGMGTPTPSHITVGYQLTPRWALQIGGLYRHRHRESVGTGTTETNQPVTDTFTQTSQATAVPVQLRYTLTRQPTHRLQVDGALGLSFMSTRYTFRRTVEVDRQLTEEYRDAQKASGTYLTGGISGRLGFGKTRRVEAVLDLLVNRNIEQFSKGVYQYLDAPGGLTRAYGLGLRYRFL